LLLGLLLGGFNIYSLEHDHSYYPQATAFTPIAVLFGLFGLAVGAPIDPKTGLLPLWVRIGYGSSAALGLGLGIAAVVFVGC
jgi:hypothetical protein